MKSAGCLGDPPDPPRERDASTLTRRPRVPRSWRYGKIAVSIIPGCEIRSGAGVPRGSPPAVLSIGTPAPRSQEKPVSDQNSPAPVAADPSTLPGPSVTVAAEDVAGAARSEGQRQYLLQQLIDAPGQGLSRTDANGKISAAAKKGLGLTATVSTRIRSELAAEQHIQIINDKRSKSYQITDRGGNTTRRSSRTRSRRADAPGRSPRLIPRCAASRRLICCSSCLNPTGSRSGARRPTVSPPLPVRR